MTRKIKTFADLRVGDVFIRGGWTMRVVVVKEKYMIADSLDMSEIPKIQYMSSDPFEDAELLPLYSSPLYLAMSELDDSPESDKDLTDET